MAVTSLANYVNALRNLLFGVDLGGKGTASNPGYVKLVDTAGVTYYLFTDTTGRLKIRFGAVPDGTGGTTVGAQS